MFTFSRLAFILFILLSVSWTPALFAQGGATGAISGTVQDQSGSLIAGAQITIINDATSETVHQLTSDSSGLFTANLLPVGKYTLRVSATGFATIRISDVQVEITQTNPNS